MGQLPINAAYVIYKDTLMFNLCIQTGLASLVTIVGH